MSKPHFFSRRNFILGSAALLAGGMFLRVSAQNSTEKHASGIGGRKTPAANARLGVNLSGIADWNSEQPFVDFFAMSRDWISQSATGWGSGPQLNLDEHGWIKALPEGTRATRIICSLDKGQYLGGEYVILYDGEGEFKMPFPAAQIVKREPGRLELLVNPKKGMFAIDLVRTNPENYVRNIRVIAPGFEASYKENPWHPEFLKRWSGVACIRLMDYMAINNSKQVRWNDRPKVADAGYSTKGVPLELLVDLANRLDTDAWFCIPHQADDDYVLQLAQYVKANLKPNLRAWVEYSNETWNGMFQQSQYASQKGQQLKLADKPWEAAWLYTAYRSIEIFKIFDSVYAGQAGLVKVLPSQAASAYTSEQIVSFNQAAKLADALAIAPYVSFNVMPQGGEINEKVVENWNLDKLFNYLNRVSLPESAKWIQESKKVADQHGLMLVAYEGGQHLVGIGGVENNNQLNKLFFEANADKRMGEVYTKNLMDWQKAGGDLFCTFNSVNEWNKWGYWGLLRNRFENPKDSPKFSAVIQWAKSRGQKMSL